MVGCAVIKLARQSSRGSLTAPITPPPTPQREPIVPPLEVGALFKPESDGTIGECQFAANSASTARLPLPCTAHRSPSPPAPAHTQPPPYTNAPPDAKAELLKLNQALLVLFLELLSVLVEQPSAYAETLTRVIGALQNMQHLVNTLRPEQVPLTPKL